MIVPVAQVLSETNDTNFLTYWLLEWRKSGAKIPVGGVVTDMGKAIQNCLSLGFNTMTHAKYNDECLILLLKPDHRVELNTQLLTDIAHLMKTVAQWLRYSNDRPKLKELLVRCVGFMTTIDNLKNFAEFLVTLFIVASSKHNNNYCQKALSYLFERIQTYKFDTNMIEEESNSDGKVPDNFVDIEDDKENSNKRLTSMYINKLRTEATENTYDSNNSSDFHIQNNDYYSLDFVERFSILCAEFPCWTKVMNNYSDNSVDVATSARSEALFSHHKSLDPTCTRVDAVFVNHARQIESDMKLARAAVDKLRPSEIVLKKTYE